MTAAAETDTAGGRALALAVDVREEAAVKGGGRHRGDRPAGFGGIDIVVNNASANPADAGRRGPDHAPLRPHAWDQRAVPSWCRNTPSPYLAKVGEPAHPDAVAAAPTCEGQMVRLPHTAYQGQVRNMSLWCWGWPGNCKCAASRSMRSGRTTIANAAIKNLPGSRLHSCAPSRKPEILAEAAHRIFQ